MIDVKKENNVTYWYITEPLCFNNIMEINAKALEQQLALNTKDNKWMIDLTSVTAIDSAGLSWLLLQKAYAGKIKIPLTILDLEKHPNATELAKVQGVFGLLTN